LQAKIFDPFDEERVKEWLATPPVKIVLSSELIDTKVGGVPRRVALIFYEEERTVTFHLADSPPPKRRPMTFGDEDAERRRHG
jgi:hypothetical protein